MATLKTQLCDICFKCRTTKAAVGICLVCREFYCTKCLNQHRVLKATEKHGVLVFEPTEGISNNMKAECDPCKKSEHKSIPASCLCGACRELYCNYCRQNHLIMVATSDHELYDFAPTSTQVSPNNINISSDFEKLTMSGPHSTSKKGPSTVGPAKQSGNEAPSEKVSGHQSPSKKNPLSSLPSGGAPGKVSHSDFEAFNNEELGAQFAVSQSQSPKTHLNKADLDKVSVKIVKTFSGETKHCKEHCCFKGLICLKDGRLLLLDYNNDKLKMFDNQCNILCSEQTWGSGWGMTKVSDDEIAVLIDNRHVYFYKVTKDKFVLQKQKFKLNKKGWGISYSRGRFAALCDIGDGTDRSVVDIYTKSGNKIRSITSFKCEVELTINIDTEEDRIYLFSGVLGRTFFCISLQGQLLWEMDFCGYDVIDVYNFLLVADVANSAIVVCTKDGSYRRTLIQDRKTTSRC